MLILRGRYFVYARFVNGFSSLLVETKNTVDPTNALPKIRRQDRSNGKWAMKRETVTPIGRKSVNPAAC